MEWPEVLLTAIAQGPLFKGPEHPRGYVSRLTWSQRSRRSPWRSVPRRPATSSAWLWHGGRRPWRTASEPDRNFLGRDIMICPEFLISMEYIYICIYIYTIYIYTYVYLISSYICIIYIHLYHDMYRTSYILWFINQLIAREVDGTGRKKNWKTMEHVGSIVEISWYTKWVNCGFRHGGTPK